MNPKHRALSERRSAAAGALAYGLANGLVFRDSVSAR